VVAAALQTASHVAVRSREIRTVAIGVIEGVPATAAGDNDPIRECIAALTYVGGSASTGTTGAFTGVTTFGSSARYFGGSVSPF
jgi:hypothetical protein